MEVNEADGKISFSYSGGRGDTGLTLLDQRLKDPLAPAEEHLGFIMD
jgi:hypothetical protein